MDRSQSSFDYVPSAEYEQKLPSAPRIYVPPPGMLSVWQKDEEPVPTSTLPANETFLRNVNLPLWESQILLKPWEYSNRRTAQRILPFLLLGPIQVARDKKFLAEEQITMALAVRNTQDSEGRPQSAALRIIQELGIELHTIDATDNQRLIAAFPRAVIRINDHLREHKHDDGSTSGNVLVYCETGNERSAGVVAAYLMESFNFDLIRAIQHMQRTRLCVNFDDAMRQMLRAYQEVLQAKRDVQQTYGPKHTGASSLGHVDKKGLKRSLCDAESMEVDEGADPKSLDGDLPNDRRFTPFADPEA